MRISTAQMFEKAVTQMTAQQAEVADLQAKLGTGKKLVKPSDDADQSALIQRMRSAIERQQVYQNTLQRINDRLGAEETALLSGEKLLQRIRELAVRATNGTLTASDRQIIAQEVTGLQDEFLALANTRDHSGNYLFSGSMVTTPAFAADSTGSITYRGDDNFISLNVSEQRNVVINRPGDKVFSGVLRTQSAEADRRVGFFAVLDDFVGALQADDTGGIERAISEISQLSESLAMGLADVGSRMEVVASQTAVLEDTELRYQMLLSDAEDLDYASAVTKLSSEIMSLEAVQSSLVKISQLSLFNFLR